MNRLIYLLPLIFLLLSACTDKPASSKVPEYTAPSYINAAQPLKEKSKADMAKMSAEDLAAMAHAADSLDQRLPDPGLKVGEKAPDFNLPDAFGRKVKLSVLLKQGPVVLVFYRGAWCPFCNLHLHTLNKSLSEIERLGGQLVTVTPQRPDMSAAQIKKSNYSFRVLSDLDNSTMKAYRLFYKMDADLIELYKKHGLDVAIFNGPGRYVLPVPGSFVINQKGIIVARHATTDYTQRMEPAAIIKALEDL